jgi:hypothetical protein
MGPKKGRDGEKMCPWDGQWHVRRWTQRKDRVRCKNKIVPRGKDGVRYRMWFEGEDMAQEKNGSRGRK